MINIDEEVKNFTNKIGDELYKAFEHVERQITNHIKELNVDEIHNITNDLCFAESKINDLEEEEEEYQNDLYYDRLETYFYFNINNYS